MDLFIRYDSPIFKAVHPATLSRKTGHSKIRFILTLLLLICLLMGCIHAPASSHLSNWENAPIDMKSVADPPGQSLLQVIIVYGNWWSHHSALRLVCPDRPVVFWDPGGSYGETFPEEVRSKDLIKVNPPDLEMYLQHIWKFTSIEVDVFEWGLKPEYGRELYDVLIKGTDKNHPAGRFTTATTGMFCTVKVGEFLHRFAGKTMIVRKSYFLPHSLAKVLYTQSPKRVLSFRRGRQTVFVPPTIINPPPLVGKK
ncbi:MAG: hypothetical protein A2Y65_07410 [Deltaproteobacteria bacterium RBG_13_52_11]|nr:MAG: hypothetical protein A2Y65_07410 [Deltaproteobacteria bacterium RBG_13_52_11]